MPTNRLINEKSPYLLQHAHNPVDWHPWGEAAFEAARRADKPIFLSIGYATCHWCHVMEKESFEDAETAALLNDTFICIKVDREERPDIDAVYMAVCHMLTGSGGWPLTIFMTPEKLPFFAATYIPKHSRFGRPGLVDLCPQIRGLWQNERGRVMASTEGILSALSGAFQFEPAKRPDEGLLDAAFSRLEKSYDPEHGGFDGAPKFPTPHRLRFLLRHHRRTGSVRALEMVEKTLFRMRLGGIWDHVGFGFHRYATDNEWFLPHFEKMLYDQALLSMAYLEAFEITGNGFHGRTAEEIFTYVLRDLTLSEGAFCAAEDADSEGEEGRFYVWSDAQFREVLQGLDPDRWAGVLGVEKEGNFRDEATGRKTGANIVHLDTPLEAMPGVDGKNPAEEFKAVRERLFDRRRRRVRPLLDDKVLCDWNGLMIAAFAMGARVLNRPEYEKAAARAARFILERMTDGHGALLHRYREGEAAVDGQAQDYAFFIMGLLELYRVGGEPFWLEKAESFERHLIDLFKDADAGGFFMTARNAEPLPARPKELYDGALPSANSVSLVNLVLLGRLTGKPEYNQEAEALMSAFSGSVTRQPAAYTHFLMGVDLALHPEADPVRFSSENKP